MKNKCIRRKWKHRLHAAKSGILRWPGFSHNFHTQVKVKMRCFTFSSYFHTHWKFHSFENVWKSLNKDFYFFTQFHTSHMCETFISHGFHMCENFSHRFHTPLISHSFHTMPFSRSWSHLQCQKQVFQHVILQTVVVMKQLVKRLWDWILTMLAVNSKVWLDNAVSPSSHAWSSVYS